MEERHYIYPSDVVSNLKPNISFSVGNSYNTLIIHTPGVTMPSEQEYNDKLAELTSALPMKVLRETRDNKMLDYDWRILRSASGGSSLSQEWITYLQALRDLPQTSTPILTNGYLAGITWPNEPLN